jgi:fermentation-respiration switch protein FrsA (DUF1100 family)
MSGLEFKSLLPTLALVCLGAYLGLGALLYLFQDRLVYAPTAIQIDTPASLGLPCREVSLTTADGLRLAAWLVETPGSRGAVLFCHGNYGNISHLLDPIRIFCGLGFDVLVFDYRGYGQSEGEPSEEGTYLDAEAARDFLVQEEGVDPARLVLCGRSLGGPIAARLARQHPPGALLLESTFTSLPELGRRRYPFFPVRRLCRYTYDTLGQLAGIRCPVLVVHSRQDDLIPFEQGQALYAAANSPKEFLEISGGHGNGFAVSEAQYRAGLERFFAAYLP